MKAWYFSNNNCRLRYDDNREIKQGVIHTVEGVPKCCAHGLHASKRIIDALSYAPGDFIWRVNITGQIDSEDDKFCGSSREYYWGFDASLVLGKFSRKCALDVIHLWDAPPVVAEYLKTGNESLRDDAWAAAGDAAGDAARTTAFGAWDAARAVAGAAARTALWDVARDAARTAEWATAGAATGAATGAAAWDVAWDVARAAAKAAAWDAEWAAARNVARNVALDKFNRRLTSMVVAEAKRQAEDT